MQLVFFWIRKYRNINNQGFNLGSEYHYEVELNTNGLTRLHRKENENYITGFFNNEGNAIENVSAIVGDNASGKSSLLTFLRGALRPQKNVNQWGEFIVGVDFVLVYHSYDKEENIQTFVRNNFDDLVLETTFPIRTLNESNEEVVYYSPVYDFSIFPIINSSSEDIDVSSNFLLYNDGENARNSVRIRNNLEGHKFQTVYRQMEFIGFAKNKTALAKSVQIPKHIEIRISDPDFPDRYDYPRAKDTPSDFIPYYNLLSKKYFVLIDELGKKEGRTNRGERINPTSNKQRKLQLLKDKFWARFVFCLLKNLFQNINRTNHYLQDGDVKTKENEYNDLNFFEAFKMFIKSQNLFPKKPILRLYSSMEAALEHLKNIEDWNDSISANLEIGYFHDLRIEYQVYLEAVRDLNYDNIAFEFLYINWKGLSSGELSYLNLFSRLYYARNIIYNNWTLKKKQVGGVKNHVPDFPSKIYLFLDEGEQGFHFQWQKEYVSKLIEAMPIIFDYSMERVEPKRPKIQVIFTTHSPISLSDIPQNSVIFIKKDQAGNCEVVSDRRPKHSFGANIHEMLYDAFYLQDGFIGKFAEKKINEVIEWCQNRNNREGAEMAKRIIDIIDDPIVKVKLSEMYADKMGYNIELARLKAQEQIIQQRINDLGQQ